MAFRLLDRKKFEAVIVDFGLGQAEQMLERVRLSEINRTVVTFAITDPLKPEAFEIQANFVMAKPLSANLVGRTLKAAFGLMVRERRRYFRCPTAIAAVVQSNGKEFSCHVVNISEKGMAVTELPSLKPGSQLRVLFTLPGQRAQFIVESEVCWHDEKGRAGLRSFDFPSRAVLPTAGLDRRQARRGHTGNGSSSISERMSGLRARGLEPRVRRAVALTAVTVGTCPTGQVINLAFT